MVKFFKVHSNFTHGVTDYGQKNQEYPEIPVIWQEFLSNVKLSLTTVMPLKPNLTGLYILMQLQYYKNHDELPASQITFIKILTIQAL